MNYHSNGWCGTHSCREVMELEDEAKSLVNLISAQYSLQNFELHQCKVGSTFIIRSLQTQSKSLRSICFDYVSFWGWEPLTSLSKCVLLQKLVFRSCHGLASELLEPLTKVKFRDLSTFLMDNSSAPACFLNMMIKNSGRNIQTLNLGQFKPHSTTYIIKTVANHCPNLTTFSSYVDSDEIDHLVVLFTLCTKLSSVTLTGPRNPEINVDDMFLRLAQQDLSSLRVLNILGAWSFTSETLRQFLVKAPIRALSIDNCHFTDDHLDVVIQSLQNTLKSLRLRLHIRNRLNEGSVNRTKGFVDVFEIESFEYNYRVSSNNNNNHDGGIFKRKFCKKYWMEKRLIR